MRYEIRELLEKIIPSDTDCFKGYNWVARNWFVSSLNILVIKPFVKTNFEVKSDSNVSIP